MSGAHYRGSRRRAERGADNRRLAHNRRLAATFFPPAMMIIPEVAAIEAEARRWRRHLHAHPETAFEERDTAAFVAERLRELGVPVHTALAKTGVVGVL